MRTTFTSDKTAGVYIILGPSGAYIGVTGNIEQRHTLKFARLIGLPSTILKHLPANTSRAEQHKAEHAAIEDYRQSGMTVVTKGYYQAGVIPTELRFSNKGRKASPELRARLSAMRRGIPKSPEHRAAIKAGLLRCHNQGERATP